jgi:hypothetical protein
MVVTFFGKGRIIFSEMDKFNDGLPEDMLSGLNTLAFLVCLVSSWIRFGYWWRSFFKPSHVSI